MTNKCRVFNEFCEEHMVDCNDEGKCPVGEVHPEVVQPGPQSNQMCEGPDCKNTAMLGEFLCEECITRMLSEME